MDMELKAENQRESIKLMKMSKGYQWEIKIFGRFPPFNDLSPAEIERLQEIDEEIKKRWGGERTENSG